MKFNRQQKITFLFVLAIFILNLFANFYLRIKIRVYDDMKLCYEKLAVAYDIGGKDGLEKEYKLMLSNAKGRMAEKFLLNVRQQLNEANDPAVFLRATISGEMQTIERARRLIIILSLLICVILVLRLIMIKRLAKQKPL